MRKRGNYRGNKKIKSQKRLSQPNVDKKSRNLKYIRRSKDTEKAHKRLKLCEEEYREVVDCDESDEELGENPFTELLCTLRGCKEQENQAAESSSEEEDVIFEEEPKHLGAEWHSSSASENESRASDTEEVSERKYKKNQNGGRELSHDKDKVQKINCIANKEKNNRKKEHRTIKDEIDEGAKEIVSTSNSNSLDPFCVCMQKELSPKLIDSLLSHSVKMKKVNLTWPLLGNLLVELPSSQGENEYHEVETKNSLQLDDSGEEFAEEGRPPELIDGENSTLCERFVKARLVDGAFQFNESILQAVKHPQVLTSLQAEIFSILNTYQDLYYTQHNTSNINEIRLVYCLHALNHMLKTRAKILQHNAKLSMEREKEQYVLPDAYRDQGLVRPKVLIILPFKDSAYKVVNAMACLLLGTDETLRKKNILNYGRFIEEYTGEGIRFPKHNPKPEDYEKTFSGNTDDSFRIGISLTKKSIKLYTDFYSSDILLASPIGLRMLIGASGDAERDFDFLSSIEILILDQVELFFAQNWDHLLHTLDHMHLQPQSIHNTDISRVRSWCLNGLSKFYRQTILLMSQELPEFRSLFNNKCLNYRGRVRQINPISEGVIRNVIVPIPQVFHRVDAATVQSSYETRFKCFVEKVLPQYKSPSMSHCMIYVPSYFDYVRLRNYFKTESMNFVQICEYTKEGKIARARDMFFHSGAHFLLYSERAHFFRRTRIKGIRHLIMYQPPNFPHFYSELINLMQEANQNPRDGLENSMSITVLFTKYDILQISAIIGTDKANKMLNSNKNLHMFITND